MRIISVAVIAICFTGMLAGGLYAQDQKAEGKVDNIDFLLNKISVKLPGGDIVDIIIGKETEILIEREKSSLDAIKYGDNIWATYKTIDGKNEAIKVIVTRPEEKDKSKIEPNIM